MPNPSRLPRRALPLGAALGALTIGLGLVVGPVARAAPDATSAVGGEFASQFLPENLPAAGIAGLYPADWPTYAASAGRNAVFPLPETPLPLQL